MSIFWRVWLVPALYRTGVDQLIMSIEICAVLSLLCWFFFWLTRDKK